MFTAVILLAFGFVTTAALSTATSAGAATQVTFRDDFSGSGLPNSTNWRLTLGHSYPGGPANFGTGEVEEMTNRPENVSVHDGALYITPRRAADGTWTSARVETNRRDFKPAVGSVMRTEGRIQMPNVTGAEAAGYWPAFWMLGGPYRDNVWSWPTIGEFDIMENVQGLNKSWAVLHCGFAPGGPCNENTGLGNGGVPCPGSTCQSAFHTYAFEWDRSGSSEQLRWYIDGQQTHTVNQSQVPADTWASMTNHMGYFMILNVAIGGAFPAAFGGGPTAATRPGVPMIVDYVQISYTGGTGSTTTNPSTSSSSTSTTAPGGTTTTAPSGGVATPTNFRAVNVQSRSVTLGWNASAGAVSYQLLRAGIQIGSTTSTQITDSNLNPNTPYIYSVRAVSSSGAVSAPTPQITVTTTSSNGATTSTTAPAGTTTTAPASGVATPTNFRAVNVQSRSVTLGWNASAGAVSYQLLRAGIQIGSTTSTQITDSNLNPNTPYIYSVRAVSSSGVVSAPTPQITVRTLA